jgi:hypothetical protein
MNLTKLTHSYHIGVAEKEANKAKNEPNLTRIASHLQQVSNRQILHSIGEFLNATRQSTKKHSVQN